MNGSEALAIAHEAGANIGAAEGNQAATDFYEQIARAMFNAGMARGAWELAKEGLRFIGDRRDVTWASLPEIDINRMEAEDPNNPGTVIDTPQSRHLCEVMRQLPPEQLRARHIDPIYFSRAEINHDPHPVARIAMRGGDLRLTLSLWRQEAADCERSGAISRAVRAWAGVARCRAALGEFVEARAALDRASALSARLTRPTFGSVSMVGARSEFQMLMNESWEEFFAAARADVGQSESNLGMVEVLKLIGPEVKWTLAGAIAYSACAYAFMGERDRSLNYFSELPDAIERGAAWGVNYIFMILFAATTLWQLNRTDNIEVIERNLRNKILEPDLRWPSDDARLSLARLTALQGRYGEALEWFAKARTALDAQGARPLRAIADYDEALMYIRRRAHDDGARALPLLEAAGLQFQVLGMPGWIKRADESARVARELT